MLSCAVSSAFVASLHDRVAKEYGKCCNSSVVIEGLSIEDVQ